LGIAREGKVFGKGLTRDGTALGRDRKGEGETGRGDRELLGPSLKNS